MKLKNQELKTSHKLKITDKIVPLENRQKTRK